MNGRQTFNASVVDYVFAERDRLEKENRKLRELLTFYLGCLTKGHVNCDSCAFKDDICGHGRKVIDGARELGIEVQVCHGRSNESHSN